MREVYVLTVYETDNITYVEGVYSSFEAAHQAELALRENSINLQGDDYIVSSTIEEFKVEP